MLFGGFHRPLLANHMPDPKDLESWHSLWISTSFWETTSAWSRVVVPGDNHLPHLPKLLIMNQVLSDSRRKAQDTYSMALHHCGLVSVTLIKYQNWKWLEEEKVCLSHRLLRPITKGSQSRNLEQKLKRRPRGVLLTGRCSASFLTQPSPTCQGMAPPTEGGTLLYQSVTKKMPHRSGYRPIWWIWWI